jgi:hypothetical protein
MQAQHAAMQQSLHYAEEAAATANSECATLAAAVQAMTEQDARARCGLAHRAHHLRGALLQTSAALRQFNDRDRRERNEVGSGNVHESTALLLIVPALEAVSLTCMTHVSPAWSGQLESKCFALLRFVPCTWKSGPHRTCIPYAALSLVLLPHCCCGLQKELRLKEKERVLLAERAALLEQQAVQQARDAALETLQLKYHLCSQKIKE